MKQKATVFEVPAGKILLIDSIIDTEADADLLEVRDANYKALFKQHKNVFGSFLRRCDCTKQNISFIKYGVICIIIYSTILKHMIFFFVIFEPPPIKPSFDLQEFLPIKNMSSSKVTIS